VVGCGEGRQASLLLRRRAPRRGRGGGPAGGAPPAPSRLVPATCARPRPGCRSGAWST
jgi:hypothetical protein